MPFKKNQRQRYRSRNNARLPGVAKRRLPIAQMVRKIANQTFDRNTETIKSVNSITDGQEIAHNSYISLSDNLLYTTQGDKNPDNSAGSNRTGDQISLRGVSLKFMVELNERYSDVTFRLMVVKCARGDNPLSGNLFNGASGNKMLDTINTDRYTIVYQKWFKLKSSGMGTEVPVGSGDAADFSGTSIQASGYGWWSHSRATKIVNCYIPGTKFTRSGVIQYENDSANPKFFDYRCLLYAYSNYSTSAAVAYNVARLNDVVKIMYYKDA